MASLQVAVLAYGSGLNNRFARMRAVGIECSRTVQLDVGVTTGGDGDRDAFTRTRA